MVLWSADKKDFVRIMFAFSPSLLPAEINEIYFDAEINKTDEERHVFDSYLQLETSEKV